MTAGRVAVVLGSVFVVSASVAGRDAHAAVRICHPALDVEVAGLTERDGRRKALTAWREDVDRVHGRRFTSWRVAGERQVSCRQFVCRAVARPCTLEQVAPTRRARPKPGLEV